MQLDLKNLLDFRPSIIPQAATADVTGTVVDTQGYNSGVCFGFIDDTAAGSFIVQDCATSGGTFEAVADAKVLTSDGTNNTDAVSSAMVTIGFVGTERYVKVFWDQTTGGDIAAGFVLGNAAVSPTGTNS